MVRPAEENENDPITQIDQENTDEIGLQWKVTFISKTNVSTEN
jgi:hypothetical protein